MSSLHLRSARRHFTATFEGGDDSGHKRGWTDARGEEGGGMEGGLDVGKGGTKGETSFHIARWKASQRLVSLPPKISALAKADDATAFRGRIDGVGNRQARGRRRHRFGACLSPGRKDDGRSFLELSH